MRIRWWIGRTIFAAIVLVVVVEGFVIANLSRIISEQHVKLQQSSQTSQFDESSQSSVTLANLRREALTRAALYDELIRKQMLEDQMVVNRLPNGQADGLCDSLLFSSIRFYALTKLGFAQSAKQAWDGILGSRNGATWMRHPRCSKSLSRDMIMGVLVALKANPEGGTLLFREMLNEIDRNWGFIGDGPFYVSWLSPGIAGLLRMEAERRDVPFQEWPWILKQSFSSIEYDAMFLGEGYVSHLAALGLWLEITQSRSNDRFNPRSFFGSMERLIQRGGNLDTEMDSQRRKWIAGRLRSLSGSNLFYEWLDQETFGTLNLQQEERMLVRLLSMHQFPKTRLPMDCDRTADYLWQRREFEHLNSSKSCRHTYSGVDFLWMAAILGAGPAVDEPSKVIKSHNAPLAH